MIYLSEMGFEFPQRTVHPDIELVFKRPRGDRNSEIGN
jgi:hypothetical protein